MVCWVGGGMPGPARSRGSEASPVSYTPRYVWPESTPVTRNEVCMKGMLQRRLVTQHVDVSDRFTAVGQHHRHIGQHLAPIMARHERAPRQGNRELTGEPGPVGQKPQASTTGMGRHARPIARYRQPRRPRSTLHLRSAFQFGDLETSKSQEFLTGQALPCIYTPTIPITRE
jgi:hypothetical protein